MDASAEPEASKAYDDQGISDGSSISMEQTFKTLDIKPSWEKPICDASLGSWSHNIPALDASGDSSTSNDNGAGSASWSPDAQDAHVTRRDSWTQDIPAFEPYRGNPYGDSGSCEEHDGWSFGGRVVGSSKEDDDYNINKPSATTTTEISEENHTESSEELHASGDAQVTYVEIVGIKVLKVTPELIREARDLDVNFDYWSARIIRWVKYGWSPKSVVCGLRWENKQDELHDGENIPDWQAYWLPGYRLVQSQQGVRTCITDEMDTDQIAERDFNRAREEWDRRFEEINEKRNAEVTLTKEEEDDYVEYIRLYGPIEEDNGVRPDYGIPPSDDDGSVSNDHESQYSAASLASTAAEPREDDWGIPIRDSTLCSARIQHRFQICTDYETGRRGKVYKLPSGMGKHIRDFPLEEESRVSIIGEDVLDNMPSANPRDAVANKAQIKVYDPLGMRTETHLSPERTALKLELIRDAAADLPDDERLDSGDSCYHPELCQKDNSWLIEANPMVTKEMITLQNEEAAAISKNNTSQALEILENSGFKLELVDPMAQMTLEPDDSGDIPGLAGILHAKVNATTALKILQKLSVDLESLHPVVLMFLKDSKLCQAIHKELVKRDKGFLQDDDGTKDFRFHGRVETVLNSLHRWATEDIESAIEDVRLILQDEDLLVEIIEALRGGQTKHDRALVDTKDTNKSCAQCGKDLKELGVIYGRDHSTLMVSGCRVCEDRRMKRAYKLLWKWRKNPDLVDDEQYEKVFGVPKGFKPLKRKEEKRVGMFDVRE